MEKQKTHKAIIKEQDKVMVIETYYLSLKFMQSVVDGYIETVNMPGDLVMVVNEEGMIKNLPITKVGDLYFYGPVLFVRSEGEELVGLTKDDVKNLMRIL